MKERIKNEKLDALDDDHSLFAVARHCREHSISKTTPFAEISERVEMPTVAIQGRPSPSRANRWAE
jgi:hypothetical protein